MASGDAFLPPVVIEITATAKAFVAKVTEVKALLLDLARQMTDMQLGLNTATFQTNLLQARTEMLAFARDLKSARLGLDAVPFWTELTALRNEVNAMSPLDINVDVHTAAAMAKIAELKASLKDAQLGAMMTPDLAGINLNIGRMFGGGGSGGGSASNSAASGVTGFIRNLFMGHITGQHLGALGVPLNIAQWLGPTLPLLTSLAGSLIAAAAGMLALGLAAGPTAYAIGQGAVSVHAANTALNNTVVGTPAWSKAITNLGNAWTAVPVPLQAAVSKILSIFSGNSPIVQQAGNWLNGIIDNLHINSGSLSKIFMPLVVATENALNKVFSQVSSLLGGGKFSGMIQSLASMVGPAIAGFAAIAGSIIKIGEGFASIGMGGQGMATIVAFFHLMAQIATSSVFEGALSGMVQFDRGLVVVVGYIVGFLDAIAKVILNVPYLGSAIKLAVGALMTISFGMWVFTGPIGKFIGGMWDAVAAATSAVGDILASFGVWIGGMLGIEGASIAMNIIVGATVVGLILALAAAIYELATHWSSVWKWIVQTVQHAISWIESHISGLSTILGAIKGAWDAIFGSGANTTHSKRAATVAAANKALKDQAAQMAAVAKNANQYQNALNGIYPQTNNVTGATQALIKAEEQIGPAIAKQGTGFGTFTQTAASTYAQLMANIKKENVTLSQEMAAAQQLIQKGMSQAAVENLAQTMPADLIMMNQQSKPQIMAMNQQFTDFQKNVSIISSKTGFSLKTQMLNGLTSAIPATQSWAKQEEQILGFNTLPLGKQIAEGVALGISQNSMRAILATHKMGLQILTVMRHAVQSHSPSRAMATIGGDLIDGLVVGINGKKTPVFDSITQLATTMTKLLHPYIAKFQTLGSQLMQGLAQGIIGATQQVVNAAVSAANQTIAATKSATKTASPSQVYAEQGRNWMLGLVQGIQGATGLVQGAMLGSLPNVGNAAGRSMAGGLGSMEVHATFQIIAPGGNPEAIKNAITSGAAQEFAHQVLVSMQSGAGTVY